MYDQFYGFSERPFSLLPDPDFLFLGDKHRAALDTLELAIFNHSGFCVISGEIGAGKTTLIRELLNRLNDDVQVGLVSNTHPSFGELMQWIMAAYGLPVGTGDRLELHKRFIDYVIQRYSEGKHTLLIIDEAQNLSMAALEELRMLSNVNSEKDLVLQIIMIGQSELRQKLRQPELVQFAQRISIDYYLGGLSPDETAFYIQHRVAHAGGAADLFTADACRRVFEFSQGIPRVINRLCDLSLVYGYAHHAEQIGADMVEAVAQEQRLGETMEAARQRMTTPTSVVKPVVAAMARATDNNSAADALIGKIDTILAAGVEQAEQVAVEETPVPAQKLDPEPTPAPAPESDDIHPELQVKPSRADSVSGEPASVDLHTLVVNAEQTAGARGERSALWLFVGVAVMFGATAWMSRDAWLPVIQDVAAHSEQGPSASKVASDAAKRAEQVKLEQARREEVKREEAARLAEQQAAEEARQEQARLEKDKREQAARLAEQQAAEKARLEQARLEKAKREQAAGLAKQQAAEKARLEQARLEKTKREQAARLAKQQAAEKARLEQARLEKAKREKAARMAKQQAERERAAAATSATWADTPDWSEGDEVPAAETAPVAATLVSEKDAEDSASEPEGFTTNPCNGPTARFLSTCR